MTIDIIGMAQALVLAVVYAVVLVLLDVMKISYRSPHAIYLDYWHLSYLIEYTCYY